MLMKYTCTLLFVIFTVFVFSQTAPTRINYQGVARSATGSPFANQAIGIKFRILQGSSSGPAVFSETQNLTTNALGLFNTQIGTSSNLGTVSWNSGSYYLEVSIDTTGGTNYITLGSQQMVSVPYALYAGSAPDPTLAITNNSVLSVGANTVVLPVNTATTTPTSVTLTGSGATSVTSTGLNSYDVNTPSVSVSTYTVAGITAGSIAQVLGTYPNYQILVAPNIQYNSTAGILSLISYPLTSPAYNYTYDITPLLALNGNTLTVGPPTNSVLISTNSAPLTSLVSSGSATTTTLGTNSFSVSVPITSITAGGGATVQGSYPSFTISSAASLPQTNVNGIGAATVTATGTNSFDVNVATPSITAGSNMTVTGSYPGFTLSSQSVGVVANPTAGLARVLGTYPNYTVTVDPNFSYSSSNGSLIVTNSGNPALSYSTNITPSLTYNSGTGVLSSGPTSNSIIIPVAITPSVTGKGAASVTPASGNNFTVNVPGTSIGSANNTATVTSSGTNTFDISVPAQVNLSATNGATLSGTYPNLNIDAPKQLTLTAAGGTTLSGAYPSQTINTPSQLNLTGTGATTVGGTYPNISVGTQSVQLIGGTTVFGVPVPSGLAQVMGSYPNYSIIVSPNIAYSSSTGSLTLSSVFGTSPAYSYAYDITPHLAANNGVIQSGPTSNTVSVAMPAAQAFGVAASALIPLAGAQLFSTSFTKQYAFSEIDIFVYTQASYSGLGSMTFDLLVDGNTSTVSVPHVIGSGGTEYITLKAVFSGLSTGSHTVAVRAKPSLLPLSVSLDPSSNGGKMILKETY